MRATFTLEVPADTLDAGDWRDDPRWDRLYELARQLFPDTDVTASGELVDDEPDGSLGPEPDALARDFRQALRDCGLPEAATLEGLLRHVRNNAKLEGAAEMYAHCRQNPPER